MLLPQRLDQSNFNLVVVQHGRATQKTASRSTLQCMRTFRRACSALRAPSGSRHSQLDAFVSGGGGGGGGMQSSLSQAQPPQLGRQEHLVRQQSPCKRRGGRAG